MKKRLVTLFLLIVCIALPSCAKSPRFGVFELERRLCELDKAYAFDANGMFRKEGVYHVFYRTNQGTLLLKAKEDTNGRLIFISLTTTDVSTEMAERFGSFAITLTDLSFPQEARSDVCAALRLNDPASFFADETLTYKIGRYQAVFFKSGKGISYMLTYA